MKNFLSLFSRLTAGLFAAPSSNYTLLAMVALVAGATVVFRGNLRPGFSTHVVMLLTLLATSRLFKTKLLQPFWCLSLGLIALVLVLDAAVRLVA